MRLRGEQLKKLAERAEVGRDELASAVERTGLQGDRARRAVNNWLSGRDHPRCKRRDIERLAAAVGAQTNEIVRFESRVNFHRGSTRKARLVVDLIRGRSFQEANELLQFNPKRAAVNIRKCLLAAMDEAQNADADEERLYVAACHVDEGPQIKRFRPKDRGRAHPITKQTSHITIGLEERA